MSDEAKTPPDGEVEQLDIELTTVEARQWTYKEVAAAKRVGVQTVMEWVKRGMIPSPIYTGFTARFTPDQVGVILSGTSRPGTYEVTPSPRSAIGRFGGSSKKKLPGKARNPAQKKKDAKPKPTLKPISRRRKKIMPDKPPSKKKGGKK